jgi:ADP-ribose pyrophosphatase
MKINEITLNKRKILLSLRRFTIIEDHIKDNSGNLRIYTYLDKPDAVGIIPILGSTIIMVEQYRHSVGDRLLEIPGGLIEQGETPYEAAKRELQEEIGFKAKELHLLNEIYPLPSVSNERIFTYYTENLVEDELNREKTESDMKLMPIPIDKISYFLKNGKILSASDALSLYMYLHLRHPHLLYE